jgi:membrane-associated phospholipid phosphatase
VRGYTFVDYATQGYIGIVGLLIALFHSPTVIHWHWLVLAHLVALTAIHCLVVTWSHNPTSKVWDFLRHFYPVLLYAGLFAETGELNQMFVQGYLDPVVIRWDQAIFGCQPSILLMQKFPLLLVSEILYAAYFSYYLMIGGVGLILYLGNRERFFHYVSVVSFVFYICYLIYIFLPIIGPPIFFRLIPGYHLPADIQAWVPPEGYPDSVKAGLFYQLMKWIYRVFEAPGAAIPSSHVAIALCTVSFSFRYIRPIRWFHTALAILLCVATVYCRYHYVSDVVAGVLTAALLVPLGNWFYFRFSNSSR